MILTYDCYNYNKTFYKIDYKNNPSLVIIETLCNISEFFQFGNGIIFMLKFIPTKNNNCHGYNISMCIYGRFYGSLAIVGLICLGFFVLFLLLLICFPKNKNFQENFRNLRKSNKILHVITNNLNFGEYECPICLSDDCSISIIETHCKHKFHEVCLKEWSKDHTNCPICRQELINI